MNVFGEWGPDEAKESSRVKSEERLEISLFGCARSQLWHAGSSFLTRDPIWTPHIGSTESLAIGPPGKSQQL